jgi:hypothetical protein
VGHGKCNFLRRAEDALQGRKELSQQRRNCLPYWVWRVESNEPGEQTIRDFEVVQRQQRHEHKRDRKENCVRAQHFRNVSRPEKTPTSCSTRFAAAKDEISKTAFTSVFLLRNTEVWRGMDSRGRGKYLSTKKEERESTHTNWDAPAPF